MADFVHFVINETRKISTSLPISVCRIIAKEAITKFPYSFGIVNEHGNVIDKEAVTLLSCLSNHNNYLNAKYKRKPVFSDVKKKDIKKIKSLSEGIPGFSGSDASDDPSEEKRIFLNLNSSIMNLNKNLECKVDAFFKDTFKLQRNFINNFKNIPTITDIQNEWPHLLKKKYLKTHFDLLLNFDTIIFLDKFKKIQDKLISFAQGSKLFQKIDFENPDLNYLSLQIISTYFSEQLNSIVINFEVCFLN